MCPGRPAKMEINPLPERPLYVDFYIQRKVRRYAPQQRVPQVRLVKDLALNRDEHNAFLEVHRHGSLRVIRYNGANLRLPDVAVPRKPRNDNALPLVECKRPRVGDFQYLLPHFDGLRVRSQDKVVEVRLLDVGLQAVSHPAERLEDFHHLENFPVVAGVVGD